MTGSAQIKVGSQNANEIWKFNKSVSFRNMINAASKLKKTYLKTEKIHATL